MFDKQFEQKGDDVMIVIPIREPEETVVRTMSKKSFENKCTFDNAWNELMIEEEKKGFTFDYIYDYMIHS